jgi:hypothetical protein
MIARVFWANRVRVARAKAKMSFEREVGSHHIEMTIREKSR